MKSLCPIVVLVSIFLVTPSVLAQDSLTGIWTGTHTSTDRCSTVNGSAALWVVQNGSDIRGVLLVGNLEDHDPPRVTA